MNKIPNRAVMCEVLMESASLDSSVVVLCSDSRGSASLVPYSVAHPQQFVEVGIAEQNLVAIAAGLASCGKRPFAVSPASFLTTRSYEQAKIDCAYSKQNVKLVGISGGISYGALGMSHHSLQDIAGMSAIPGMRVYVPSDRHLTKALFKRLVYDNSTAYIRLGRNPVEDIYDEEPVNFTMDKSICLKDGFDATIIACGELVHPSLEAAKFLEREGIHCRVIDMYCVKPLDKEAVLIAAKETHNIFTVEEHSPYGGLGASVSQCVSAHCPCKVVTLSLPDEPVVTGNSAEVFRHYHLDAEGICATVVKELRERHNG